MASEATPLLSLKHAPTVTGQSLQSGLEPRSYAWLALTLPYFTITRSWFSMLLIVLSFLACIATNYTSWSVLDPLIFKSLMVVFGFAIGFRNVRANSRRGEAMDHLIEFFGAAWSIILLFPDEARAEVVEEFTSLSKAFAVHVGRVANRSSWTLGIVGLQPLKDVEAGQESIFAIPRPIFEASLSPRPFMISVLQKCEDLIDKHEPKQGDSLKMHRLFWLQQAVLMNAYDGMLKMALPAISDRYVSLIEVVLCIFGIFLPWGIRADDVDLRRFGTMFYLPAQVWLAINTLLVILVLFGLNTLAAENENPFHNDLDNLDVGKFAESFNTAVKAYQDGKTAFREQRNGTSSHGVVAHRYICGVDDVKTIP